MDEKKDNILFSLQIKPEQAEEKSKPADTQPTAEKKTLAPSVHSKSDFKLKTLLKHPLLLSFIVGIFLSFFIYIFVPFSLEERAKRGMVEAQYEFAIQNYETENYDRYLLWMRKASDQGLVRASYHLGLFYKDSIPYQDYTKAQDYLKKAADKNHLKSQILLGLMYKDGIGAKQDYKQAFNYLKLAADAGDKTSAFHLATLYMLGQGTSQDYKQARLYALKCSSGEDTPLVKLIESKMNP